jgi:hypothetical protein
MENAVEALYMGFAVLVFAIALTVFFNMASIAKDTSEDVFLAIDESTYINYTNVNVDDTNSSSRVVDFNDIIPIIYRYCREGFGITFIDGNKIVARFSDTTETLVNTAIWNQSEYLKLGVSEKVSSNKAKNSISSRLNYITRQIGITIDAENYTDDEINNSSNWVYSQFDQLEEIMLGIYATDSSDTKKIYAPWIGENIENSDNMYSQRIDCDLYGGTTYFNTLFPGLNMKISGKNQGSHTAVCNGDGLNKKYGIGTGDSGGATRFTEYVITIDPNEHPELVDEEEGSSFISELDSVGDLKRAKIREIIYVKK